MEFEIRTGDALKQLQLLPSGSVDCCVTSPPYYHLRDYGVEGQLGLEDTPDQYIEKLIAVFREVRRVLKDSGTLWINIADTYMGSGNGRNKDGLYNPKSCHNVNSRGQKMGRIVKLGKDLSSNKPKDLIGIPFMLALALKEDGWYLRQDIIWNKSNPMPESVKDRCTRSHEYIFLLTKSRKYFFDSNAIKEPCIGKNNIPPAGSKGTQGSPNSRRRIGNKRIIDTKLRSKRDVWTVATHGARVEGFEHYATFPPDLIKPCILAGCPVGGTVLDPFVGSGTTLVVSQRCGRNGIGIELNPEYAEQVRLRIEKESK